MNNTNADQVFTIEVTARVTTLAGNTHSTTRTNTATFTRTNSAGTSLTPQTAATTTTIVEPNPTITKSHTPSGTVSGGDVLTYTLAASNATGRPTLFDAVVTDCIPADLTNAAVQGTPVGATSVVAGDGSNGCAVGTTRLRWSGFDLAAGVSRTLTYTVKVKATPAGGATYTNNVGLAGTTLAGDQGAIERSYPKSTSDNVTVAGSTLGKSTSTPKRAVGERAEFTVTATVPANVNYYDATVVDTLPAGLDAATVAVTASTCTLADSTPCVGWTAATPVALTASGQKVGWFLGDLTVVAQTRTITITYTALVKDVAGNEINTTLTNSALLGWNQANKTDPTTVGTTPDRTAGPATATTTVTEPQLSIDKTVDDATVEPGQTFTYTVKVSNANNDNTSAAFDVTVTDTVPNGVIVNASTITGGGKLTGAATTTGGGTITWTIPGPIAEDGSITRTYDAKLASPSPAGGVALINTAKVTEYHSTAPDGDPDRSYTTNPPTDTATVTPQLPHVVVAKGVQGGDLAYRGEAKTWTITVTSDGGAAANDIDVVDTLPADWTYVTGSATIAIGTGGQTFLNDPTISDQQLTWTNVGDLPDGTATPAGRSLTITFQATPSNTAAVGHSNPHTNTVGVTAKDALGETEDASGNPFNGPDATKSVYIDSADVKIVKAKVGTPVAGAPFSWTLTVSNDGPDTAVGPFTVADSVPAPLTGVSASGTGWTCSATGTQNRTVECSRTNAADTLAKDASFPAITITGTIPADTAKDTVIANTATVAGPKTHEPNPGNNTSTTTDNVTVSSDLKIVKTLDPDRLVPGENATYKLVVSNQGPSDHHGLITVADPLPAGTTAVSISGTDWTCDQGTRVCTYGGPASTLPSGASLPVITVTVKVDADRTSAVTNTATVTGTDPDPTPGNNTSTVTKTPTVTADLAIVKSVDKTTLKAGEGATYTLEVTNNGPSDAPGVTVVDTLPAGVTYVAAGSGGTGWTCSADSGTPQKVTCTLDAATLAAGATANDITINVTVDPDRTAGTNVTNSATVSTTGTDPVPGNNTDDATFNVTREADVSIEKTHVGSGLSGQTIDFTLTVTNDGPSSATGLQVVDTLPTGLDFVSATGTGWTCSAASEVVTCNRAAALAPGATSTITVVATVTAGQFTSVTNTVEVTSTTPDPDSTNNDDEDTVPVTDSNLSKSTSTPNRAIGEKATYTLVAELPAQANLYNVMVTDQLPVGVDPASVELVTGSPTCDLTGGATCTVTATELTANGQTIGWTFGDLAKVSGAETTRTVTLTYTAVLTDVTTSVDGAGLVNRAKLGWDTSGTIDPSDDPTTVTKVPQTSTPEETATVTVVEPKLAIAKTVDNLDSVVAAPGEEVTYRVTVTNNGTAPAYDMIVKDAIPAGITVVASSLPAGASLSGSTITWTVPGPIEVGAGKAITLTYQGKFASPAPEGDQTNVAKITEYHSTPTDGDDDRKYLDGVDPKDLPTADAVVSPEYPHVTIAKTVMDDGQPAEDTVAYIGEATTWRLVVTSDSDVQANNIDVSDTLPENWTYVPGSALVSVMGATAKAVEPAVSGTGDRTLKWTDLGDLPAKGDKIVILFQAKPGADVVTSPGVGSGVRHVNTASVTAQDADGNTGTGPGTPYNGGPDTAGAHIDSADLVMKKTPQDDPAIAGQNLSWTLTVTNKGADKAVGPFTVVDTMPSGMEAPYSASGTDWTCSATTTITCTIDGELAAGDSLAPITVTAKVPAAVKDGTEFTNEASVDGRTYDPDEPNNTDDSTVEIGAVSDLSILKKRAGKIVAGEVATYSLDVTNNGPSVHRGPLVVTDPIPSGTTFVAASGTGWDCAEAGGTLTCERTDDTHLVGGLDQITVAVMVDADRTADVVNTATVKGDGPGGTPDPTPGNNTDTDTGTPGQSADLSINKESVGNFVSGTNDHYRFTVHNDGPSVARGVRFTDRLPAGTTYVGSNSVSGSWQCSVTGQDLTCELNGTLGPDDDAVVRVEVAIDAAHTGDLENSATVESTTPDPVPENNTDTDHTDGRPESDLALTKTQTSPTGPVTAGETVTYSLKVTNNGPSVSHAPIKVIDHLPAGMTCLTIGGNPCAGDTGEFTRSADLGVGDSFTVEVEAKVAPDAGPGTLQNNAVVTAPEEIDPTNNADSTPTEIVDEAELTLTKTADAARVVAGEEATFTIEVTNAGPSDADNVIVTDLLPAGMSVGAGGLSGAGWTCSVADLRCERATLAAGATATITVVALVDSSVPDGGDLVNTASVSTTTPGDDPADNTDDATVTVDARADLVLVKKHTGTSVAAGTSTSYRLEVANNGSSDALGPITITDTLPTGFGFLSAFAPWTCSATGLTVECTLADGIVAGASAPVLDMLVQLDADLEKGDHTNTATVSSPTTDPTPGNNTDSSTVTAERGADISVVKTHRGSPVVGEEFEYVLQVHNNGPSTARDVVLEDMLPAGLTLVSATGAGWTCNDADEVRCRLDGPLAPDADAAPVTVTVRVGPAAYPELVNTAAVESSTPDVEPGDNTSTDRVPVPPSVDIQVTKTHAGDLQVGSQGTYTITVRNAGATDGPSDVTVTDSLPNGLSFVSASAPAGWSCSASGQVVTCTGSGLAAGEEKVIDLTVDVLPEAYPSVTNVVTVTTPDPEEDPDDNTDTDETGIVPNIELAVKKEVLKYQGSLVTWRITVSNLGRNATVEPIVLTDELVDALKLVEISGDGWVCSGNRTIVCRHAAPLAPGKSASIELVTKVEANPGTSITNSAYVDGQAETDDADRDNNDDDAVIKVDDHDNGKDPDNSDNPDNGNDPSTDDLPDTGGPQAWLLGLGLLLLLAGAVSVRRASRAAPAGRRRD